MYIYIYIYIDISCRSSCHVPESHVQKWNPQVETAPSPGMDTSSVAPVEAEKAAVEAEEVAVAEVAESDSTEDAPGKEAGGFGRDVGNSSW